MNPPTTCLDEGDEDEQASPPATVQLDNPSVVKQFAHFSEGDKVTITGTLRTVSDGPVELQN